MSFIARALRPKAAPARAQWGIPAPYYQPGSYASGMDEGPGMSLQKVAIWASIDLIVSLASEMPWDVLRGTGPTAVEVTKPSYMEDPSGEGYGYNDWAFQLLQCWLTGGNGHGEVLARDPRGGFPTQVSWWPPGAVSAQLAEGKVQWSVQGRPVTQDMWHLRVFPVAGSVLGLSPIGHHMTTIGQGIAAARFGHQFFLDGAHPGGILQNDVEEIDEPQAKAVKARWMAVMHGSREPAVFGRGWNYKAVQVAPEESQFLETQRFSASECCKIYGPGVAELLGYNDEKSMTYTNVVDRRADFLVLAMNKWLNRLERVLTGMLPRGQSARLNRNSLLQATTLDRFKAYELALKNRWTTPNEVRALEDQAPVKWGDEPITASGPAPAPSTGVDDGTNPA